MVRALGVALIVVTASGLAGCATDAPTAISADSSGVYFDAVSGYKDGRVFTDLYHGNQCGKQSLTTLSSGGAASDAGPNFDLSEPGRLHKGSYPISAVPGREVAAFMLGRRTVGRMQYECSVWTAWTPRQGLAYDAVFYWEDGRCTAGIFERTPGKRDLSGSDGTRYRSVPDAVVYDGNCRRLQARAER